VKLKILTWNTLYAGYDGLDDRRAKAQIDLLDELKPDVLLMQEAKGLEANGNARLFELEARTGMRGFLALAPRTGQNIAIFIREPLRPLAFETDGANFHHTLASLRVVLPGSETALTLMSAHLCPNGALVRQREAAYLAVQAIPDRLTLLAGDFNSVSPHDTEPDDFAALPAHHRTRYLADDLRTIDRRVMAQLESAGWVDVAYALGTSDVPTVPTRAYSNAEFAPMRCDYLLASRALANCARTCEVVRTPATDMASDHYPVLAIFDLRA
jgi:Exonuclease III